MKKGLLVVFKTLILCSMLMLVGCEEDSSSDYSSDGNGNGGGNGNTGGSWVRSDNGNSFLKFEGSTAKACVGGNLTTGTFNGSSMTFVVGGNTITFPLDFYSDHLVVGVPEGSEDTNYEMTYYHSDSFPCSGGNGGGGGSTTGNATFWIQSDLGCGSINVSLSGQGGTITSYYGSIPSCGASGCANFTLPEGTYSFSANCSEYTWNGTITITNGQCSKMQLTL